MVTLFAPSTKTPFWAGLPSVFAPLPSRIVFFASLLVPTILMPSFLWPLTTTPSTYLPGLTFTVPPLATLSTAFWMVEASQPRRQTVTVFFFFAEAAAGTTAGNAAAAAPAASRAMGRRCMAPP